MVFQLFYSATIKQHVLFFCLFMPFAFAQTLKSKTLHVGTTQAATNASAALQIEETTKGFLPPRMTTTQRDAIASPAIGLTIYNTTTKSIEWWDGSIWYSLREQCLTIAYPQGYSGTKSEIVELVSVTNKIWMDRNLGATQVATSTTDAAAYGDLFQWGRFADGHQSRTSSITNTLSTTTTPNHNLFISPPDYPYDWLSTQNDNLWQNTAGSNNPCPNGYRLPTIAEFNAELEAYTNSQTQHYTALKLTTAGNRRYTDGNLIVVNERGYYWTSTLTDIKIVVHYFTPSVIDGNTTAYASRAYGLSVRCIKGN